MIERIRSNGLKCVLDVAACFFLLLCFSPGEASAHAYLDRSDPAQESELTEAPAEIRLRFTEPIDTRLSRVTLQNDQGVVIDTALHGEDQRWLILTVPPLENGVYHVSWQVLSLDTHVTDGSFRFAVGVALPKQIPDEAINIDAVLEEEEEQGLFASLAAEVKDRTTAWFRIAELLLLIVIGGRLFFTEWMIKPLVQKMKREKDKRVALLDSNIFGTSRNRERILYLFAFFLFAITGAGHLHQRVTQLGHTFGSELYVEASFIFLSSTVLGWMILARLVFVLLLFGLTFLSSGRGWKTFVMILLLGTFALTAHAVQKDMVFSHFIHLTAVAVWLGGLTGLVWLSFRLPGQAPSLQIQHLLLSTFSKLALWLVVLIVISGALLSIVLTGQQLFSSNAYSMILLLKLLLVGVVLLIAATHRFLWLPRLKSAKDAQEQGLAQLQWALRLELIILYVILLVAGLLSTTPPPGFLG